MTNANTWEPEIWANTTRRIAAQAVLDAALAVSEWRSVGVIPSSTDMADWNARMSGLNAAVAVYRASLNDTPCPPHVVGPSSMDGSTWCARCGAYMGADDDRAAIEACGGSGVAPTPATTT